MKKLIRFQILVAGLSLLMSVLFSRCERIETRLPEVEAGNIDYMIDIDKDTFTPLAGQGSESGARVVATVKGKLTFEYITNEGEIISGQWSQITLWFYGATDPGTNVTTRFTKPKYTVTKPDNKRSYTRKSLTPGWYLIQLDDRTTFDAVNVTAGSDGLLIWNDKGSPAPKLQGYYDSYGKCKFTFGKTATSQDQAFAKLSNAKAVVDLWLYADVTTSSLKNCYWFMPTGEYSAEWYASGSTLQHKTKTITIASGKVYPTMKL